MAYQNQGLGGMMQPQQAQAGGFQPQQVQNILGRLQDPQQRMAAAQMFAQQFDVPNMQGFGNIPPPLQMGGPQLPTPPSLGTQMQPAQLPQMQQQQGGMNMGGLGSLVGLIPGLGGGNSNLNAVMTKT